AQRRDRVLQRGPEVLDERVRRRRERLEARERELRLVEERREDLERVGQRLLTTRRCVERLPGRDDEVVELALVLGERAEHDAGVADERLRLMLLAVEDPQQVGAVVGEGGQGPEGVVEVLAVAADRLRRLLLPALERGPRPRVERVEDLVELPGPLHLRVRELPAVG